MAVNTLAQGSVVLTSKRLVQMATPTEIVKLLLHDRGELRIAVMAVDAKTLPGIILIVVMAVHTALPGMINMRKFHRQWRRQSSTILSGQIGFRREQHQDSINTSHKDQGYQQTTGHSASPLTVVNSAIARANKASVAKGCAARTPGTRCRGSQSTAPARAASSNPCAGLPR